LKRKPVSKGKPAAKKRSFYVPTTTDMFRDHIRVRGLKVSPAKAERLSSLYDYLLGEQCEVSWPHERSKIEDSIPYYKAHRAAVLESDLKTLVDLGVVQETEGKLRLSFIDFISGGVAE
jgi:hypothetical protein